MEDESPEFYLHRIKTMLFEFSRDIRKEGLLKGNPKTFELERFIESWTRIHFPFITPEKKEYFDC